MIDEMQKKYGYTIIKQSDGDARIFILDGEGLLKQTSSLAFQVYIYFISIGAMISNCIKVCFRKEFFTCGFKSALWSMGRDKNHFSSIFFDRFSNSNHETKVQAASYWALKPCYNFESDVLGGEYDVKGDYSERFFSRIMGKTKNRVAVANRLKIATDLIVESVQKFSHEEEVRLLSVASGSAQAVVQALSRMPELNVKVVLIDIDKTALEEAHRLCKKHGIDPNSFKLVHNRTSVIEEVCKDFQPHIIEMIGFLDYRPKNKAIDLIGRLKKCLVPEGVLLTCNIKNNSEKIFLDWVLLWPMIYRSEYEFMEVLQKSGFKEDSIELMYESGEIHGIAYCINR